MHGPRVVRTVRDEPIERPVEASQQVRYDLGVGRCGFRELRRSVDSQVAHGDVRRSPAPSYTASALRRRPLAYAEQSYARRVYDPVYRSIPTLAGEA